MTSFFMFNMFGAILLHFVFQCRLHGHVFYCRHVLAIKKEANKTVHPPLRDFLCLTFYSATTSKGISTDTSLCNLIVAE